MSNKFVEVDKEYILDNQNNFINNKQIVCIKVEDRDIICELLEELDSETWINKVIPSIKENREIKFTYLNPEGTICISDNLVILRGKSHLFYRITKKPPQTPIISSSLRNIRAPTLNKRYFIAE